jgi:hypothetical protein
MAKKKGRKEEIVWFAAEASAKTSSRCKEAASSPEETPSEGCDRGQEGARIEVSPSTAYCDPRGFSSETLGRSHALV